jgi:formylglycine-generating enzyme required for sulfatase activity
LQLACHAALPLILTPELLNLIRINFLADQAIPWVAEVDFLLSSLCHPIGEGLYEVEPSIREVLMVELENQFGWRIVFRIAEFLEAYLEKQTLKTNPEVDKTLSWIARAYLDPDQVVKEIAESLENIGSEPELLPKLQGQLQAVLMVGVLEEPLREANEIEAYQSLVANCETVARGLYGDEDRIEGGAGIGEQAETSYNFTVNVFSGSQQGQTYQGTFSYDPALLTGRGEESLGIDQIQAELTYNGERHTRFDSWSKLVFVDGHLQKLQLEGGSDYSRFGINSGFGLDWIQEQFNTHYRQSYEAAGENFFGYLDRNRSLDGVGAVTFNPPLLLLKPFTFDIVEFVEEEEPELPQFEFETVTVTVDARGQEIDRRSAFANYYFVEPLDQAVRLEMVDIPGGSFEMGSPADEPKRGSREDPQHSVTVPPFFMGKYLVTQAQWKAVAAMPQVNRKLNPDPARFKGDNLPVERVDWHDAVEFCDRLLQHTGRIYRLPSEAEWEYACRAGTITPFHFGETITTELANYNGSVYRQEPKGKSRGRTTPVGSFLPNRFGLYDMHGNVREWCADHWHDNYEGAPIDGSAWIEGGDGSRRVLRGGSWDVNPLLCRSAYRVCLNPDFANNDGGFRVVSSASRTL